MSALVAAGCSNDLERSAERDNVRVREDVRSVRDFFRERGVTVDTRLPDR